MNEYKLNVNNFKDILKKATLNFSINTVNLIISENKIISRMINDDKNVIILLNKNNNVIENLDEKSTIDFNFSEPNQQLIPFLNIIDDNEALIKISDEKITIKNRDLSTNIFFCSPTIVNTFSSESAKNIDSFIELDIDEDFYQKYLKIKKIGIKFGKVYFTVKNNKFLIETLDKSNTFSNGASFKLKDINMIDLTMLFNFKNFINLMSVVNENHKLKFSYLKEHNMGMLSSVSNNESEKYYLMSQEEI